MKEKGFEAPGDPLTIKLLGQLMPGPRRKVRDFSLHFPMEGVATMRIELILTKDDVEKIVCGVVEYEIQIKDGE